MIEPGTQLQGRFLIEELIGEGGMGAVYLATDQKFGTRVAVKETFYGEAQFAEAFEREARLLNGLHHPVFPHVSDHFTENGGHFLVMEYIEGEDLSAIIKRGETFAADQVIRWTLDLLDGLDYLHSQDPPVIHRDIKPNNLKLTSRGNIVLLDFGMAKETSGNTLGMKSVFGYSRRYSPLEQIEGTGTDVRSDIFSLGATVFHLLAGTPPTDVLARASAIVGGRPDPLRSASSVNDQVPEAVAAVLRSALALNPDERFISARSMRAAIENAVGISTGEVREEAPAFSDEMPPVVVSPAETFPALAAYEAETTAEVSEIAKPVSATRAGVHLGTVDPLRMVDYLPAVAVPEPKKPSAVPAAGADQVRIRKPIQRRAYLWLPVVVLCAALLGYGVYRQLPASAAAAQETPAEPAVLAADVPAQNLETAVVAETVSEEVEPEVQSIPEREQPLFAFDETEEADDTTIEEEKPASTVSRRTARPVKVKEAEIKAAETKVVKEPVRTPVKKTVPAPARKSTLPSRPRVVRSAPYGWPRASDIDAVMNGGRDGRRPRLEDRWEDEERRRRRARRARWENRNRFPPF